MTTHKDLSVIIGFKDWGLTRLRLAITALHESFGAIDGEVIVSDYGSGDTDGVREVVESLGARYIYTETDGTWSRSRALNIGAAASSGRVLVSTDADMLFSPGSMELVGRRVLADPDLALLLQCRDLPQGWSAEDIDAGTVDWAAFDRVGRRRPRWGMGGMIAVSRGSFLRIRGYDERMHTYGGEDIDFAYRIKRAGARLVWVEHPDARMYHMFHPSTAAQHSRSPEATAAVEFNKSIVRGDKTFVRNVTSWIGRPADAPPLVSVVIATYNRSQMLREALWSIQAQTVQDFEIIVVDDGSTDDTRSVVEDAHDERIRYVFQENAGVAAARNHGVDLSRGYYIAVMDDDDIALPWRLEAQFDALVEGSHATFGSFANFDDETGEMTLYRTKQFTDAVTADKGGAPGHSTWMVERRFMAAIRYDESLSSGIDNNFALRSVRSGLVWKHTGRVHALRRMHAQQITSVDNARQVAAARTAYSYFTFTATPWGLDKLRKERGQGDYVTLVGSEDESLYPYLPDALVRRSLVAVSSERANGADDYVVESADSEPLRIRASEDLRWRDLAALKGAVSLTGMSAVPREAELAPPGDGLEPVLGVVGEFFDLPIPGDNAVVCDLLAITDDLGEDGVLAWGTSVVLRQEGRVWTWWRASLRPEDVTGALVDDLGGRGAVRVHGSEALLSTVADRLLDGKEMAG